MPNDPLVFSFDVHDMCVFPASCHCVVKGRACVKSFGDILFLQLSSVFVIVKVFGV